MCPSRDRLPRRRFLQAVSAGIGGSLATLPGKGRSADRGIAFDSEHAAAVNRQRRIVVQYDAQSTYEIDFETWIDYRFKYIDEPGSQIDSVFWDLGRLGQVLYPSKFLDPLQHVELQKWRDRGLDMAGRLIEETKKRSDPLTR